MNSFESLFAVIVIPLIISVVATLIAERAIRFPFRIRVAVLSLAVLAMVVVYGLYINNSQAPVAVPDVSGKSQAVAEKEISNAGLTPAAINLVTNASPDGLVVSNTQDPPPGLVVQQGTVVTFAVSMQVKYVLVNNTIGIRT